MGGQSSKTGELVSLLTREAARILKTREQAIRVLIYEMSKEGLDMK
jgi:phenylpyruvate tautomerase PptA (4-oxalocrotonate tautomerase family)